MKEHIDLGWIYLTKKIMNTSFYTNVNTCHLAIHLLLQANWKDTKFIFNKKEIILQRGQHLTGLHRLSEETGLTIQNLRTSLDILENCNFLTSKSTNKFRIITITKYDDYQHVDNLKKLKTNKQNNNPLTIKQQSTNNQLTTPNTINTNNTDNNNNEIEHKDNCVSHKLVIKQPLDNSYLTVIEYFNSVCNKKFHPTKERINIIKACVAAGRSIEAIKKAIYNFSLDDWPDRHKYCDLIYAIGVRNKVDNFDKWFSYISEKEKESEKQAIINKEKAEYQSKIKQMEAKANGINN